MQRLFLTTAVYIDAAPGHQRRHGYAWVGEALSAKWGRLRGGAMSIFEDAAVRAADRAARAWVAAGSGPITPGTEEHKVAFCRMLLDTHNPYKPSIIDWPALEPEARDRLIE